MLKPAPLRTRPAHRFLHDRSGATAIEYGLIVGLVAVVLLAGLGNTSNSVAAMFNNVMERVSEAMSSS